MCSQNSLFFRIKELPSACQVIDAGVDGKVDHHNGKEAGDGGVLIEERGKLACADEIIDHRLDHSRANGDDLGHGLDLAQHIRRNDHTAGGGSHQTNGGHRQLTENDNDQREEIKRGHDVIAHHSGLEEDAEERADDHEFVSQGVHEFAEIGDQAVLSCDLAVQHVGQRCRNKEDCTHKGQNHVGGCRKACKYRQQHHHHEDRHHNKAQNG